MRIAAVDVLPLRLPFREEFRIARGSVGSPETGAPHVYVRVRTACGAEGWGEARPSHRWSYETEESVVSTLRVYLAPAVIGLDAWDLETVHARMDAQIAPGISTGAPIARSALDMALHDLLARAAGVSLSRFLGGPGGGTLALSYLVSVPRPEEAARRAASAWEAGYRGLKVKIGAGVGADAALLREVRQAAPEAYLWADANQAYDAATALSLARRLEPLGVDCLEQPVPANDWTGLRRLCAGAGIPIAVDESVYSPADLVQLVRLEAADVLVVKLSRMGGVRPALLGARLARAAGMGILGSGLTESRLGFMAAAHVLTAAGGCRFADLNGPQFLADDPAVDGPEPASGSVRVPENPGIGVALDPEKLERLQQRPAAGA